jgi:coenzyme PQQ precursor peptide PqqA
MCQSDTAKALAACDWSRLSWNCRGRLDAGLGWNAKETTMAWTTPTLVEICIGLEINGYLPAEF